MKAFFYALSLLTLFACSGKEKSGRLTVADSVETTSASSPAQPVGGSSSNPASKKPTTIIVTKWLYEKTIDKAGRTVYKASINSPNLLQFGFPYAGGSTATLTIRKRDSDTHVYLHVSKGQFNRSFQGGNANIRFDGNPARSYAFSAAENGSANIIFFDSEQKLIDKMKAARKMIVDIEFYAQGKRQIEFEIADLTWNH